MYNKTTVTNAQISNMAVIHPKAKIGKNVKIDPFAIIEEDVIIGDNTWIASHVVIMNGARIGNNCKIYPGAIISAAPQDLKFDGEYSIVKIGNNVTVREYCTINRGTKANHSTIIEDNCLLMAYVHVAHDCIVEPNCVLANNATLAGHVELGEYAIIGGLVGIHQFVKIGKHAIIGGGVLVRKDVPPYVKAGRTPVTYLGVNSIGLKRRNFTIEQIHAIQDIYRILYVKNNNISKAIEIIQNEIPDSLERREILAFIDKAERGIIKGL